MKDEKKAGMWGTKNCDKDKGDKEGRTSGERKRFVCSENREGDQCA